MLSNSLRSNSAVITQPHHMRRVLTPLKSQPQPRSMSPPSSVACQPQQQQPQLQQQPPQQQQHAQPTESDGGATATLRMSTSFALQYSTLVPAAAVAAPAPVMDHGPVKRQANRTSGSRSREALTQEVDALWHALSLMAAHLSAEQLHHVRNRVSVDLNKWDTIVGEGSTGSNSAAFGGDLTSCESTTEFVKNDSFAVAPLTFAAFNGSGSNKENTAKPAGRPSAANIARRVSFSCPDATTAPQEPAPTRRPCTVGAGFALTSVDAVLDGDSPAPLPPTHVTINGDLELEEAVTPQRRITLSAEAATGAVAAPVTPVPAAPDSHVPFRRGGARA